MASGIAKLKSFYSGISNPRTSLRNRGASKRNKAPRPLQPLPAACGYDFTTNTTPTDKDVAIGAEGKRVVPMNVRPPTRGATVAFVNKGVLS